MWTLYFKDPEERRWDLDSYDVVCRFPDEDIPRVLAAFSLAWKCGSFFLMRNGVPPMWEHPENSRGGCLSFTVPIADTSRYMSEIVCSILERKYTSLGTEIHGVSCASKKGYSLVRVWTKTAPVGGFECIKIPVNAHICFKPHNDAIRGRKVSVFKGSRR